MSPRIRTRTINPEAAVNAAIAPIAKGIPPRSARTPATIAPAAKPRSRHSPAAPRHDGVAEHLMFFWVDGAGGPQLVEPVDELRLNCPDS